MKSTRTLQQTHHELPHLTTSSLFFTSTDNFKFQLHASFHFWFVNVVLLFRGKHQFSLCLCECIWKKDRRLRRILKTQFTARILSDETAKFNWLHGDYDVNLKLHDPRLLPCSPHQQQTDSFLINSSARKERILQRLWAPVIILRLNLETHLFHKKWLSPVKTRMCLYRSATSGKILTLRLTLGDINLKQCLNVKSDRRWAADPIVKTSCVN